MLEAMKAEFEKWHRFPVTDDMDIHTAVAWDSWRIAWSAGVQSTKTPHKAAAEPPLDCRVMRCLADMAQATAWLNFSTAQANHDLHHYGTWQCDYTMQASAFQRDYENAARELAALPPNG